MKKLISGLVLGFIILNTSIQAGQSELDINKLCLGKYCLGDPASKHGGLKSFKQLRWGNTAIITPLPRLPIPNCGSHEYGFSYLVVPPGVNTSSPSSFTYIEIAPFPEFLKEGIDSYYRIIKVETRYPRINREDQAKLLQTVADRTEVKSSKSIGGWGSVSTSWNSRKGLVFLHVGEERASINLNEYSLIYTSVSGEVRNQPGCTSKAPKL